jgi:glycosyltransferase involved in cell wall biosynthesis
MKLLGPGGGGRDEASPVRRVLFFAPDLAKGGGVSGYCRVLLPSFSVPVDVIQRGARRGERRRWGPLRILRDAAQAVKAMRSGEYDVVHQNTSFGAAGLLRDGVVMLMAALMRRPILLFVHGWDAVLAARMTGPRLALFRSVYFRADAMAVLAGSFRDSLREWGYRGPIYVETTVVEDACLVDEGGIVSRAPGEPFTVLFMARVGRAKGIFVAIEAVRLLGASGVPVRLVVAGAGEDLEEARQAAMDAGIDASFAGYVQGLDKLQVLRAAHAYLLPTTHGEGLPTTVLEAMAAGVPVVTRPVGGVTDTIDNGVTGLVTESTNPADFAALIERLSSNEPARVEIARRASAVARDRFVASRVVQRIERIYAEILAR